MHILVAEDSPVNQKLAMTMLKRMGHDVAVAATGSEAIDLWQQKHFDLILMDVQMPEIDGLQATRRIREIEKSLGDHVPIIAMTAHAMQGDRSSCLEAGMDDYIAKPVSRKVLEDVVQRHSAGLKLRLP